jgi:hypothetical protein
MAFALALAAPSVALARDADSIIFGSQLDALTELADDDDDAVDDEDVTESEADEVDPEEDSEDEAAAEDDDESGPETDFTSGFTLRGGYDSNHDESTEPEGSTFVELSGDATWAREGEKLAVYGAVGAGVLRLNDLEWKERGSAYVDAAARYQLNDDVAVLGGVGLILDATSDPVEAGGKATLGIEAVKPFGIFGLRAGFVAERAIAEVFPSEDVDFRAYDFHRPEIEASALLRPDAKISPFVTTKLSRTSFPVPLPDDLTDEDDELIPVPVRDAVQVSALAGLRFSPHEDVTIRIGPRLNWRRFAEPGQAALLTVGPDIEAEWQINDQLSLSGSVSRTIEEPTSFAALADDLISASATLSYDSGQKLSVDLSAGYDRTREIGTGAFYDEYALELDASYKVTDNASLRFGYLYGWSVDHIDGENYDRMRIGAGGRLEF